MAKAKGLYANIHREKKEIAAGSGEKMRRPGAKGAPTKNICKSAQQKNLRKKSVVNKRKKIKSKKYLKLW